MRQPNAQYNLATPGSLSMKIAASVRTRMFEAFMTEFMPDRRETILDIGVTSDKSYTSSNYFESLYPYKDRITAAGLDEGAITLQSAYPGLKFVCANALALPFDDGSFDLIHSSAVLEHVGSAKNQGKMISECLRVCRRGVYLTTPNRWFPIEVHTGIPLVHWLPKTWGRSVFRSVGYEFFAHEENLNLMTAADLSDILSENDGYRYRIIRMRLFGWSSNLVAVIRRLPQI